MTIANEEDDSLPKGDGFATLTVTGSGGVRVVGKLPDGVPFTQGASITDTEVDTFKWPLFISLNNGAETASCWMQMYPGELVGSEWRPFLAEASADKCFDVSKRISWLRRRRWFKLRTPRSNKPDSRGDESNRFL
jgi:hypothetical protein